MNYRFETRVNKTLQEDEIIHESIEMSIRIAVPDENRELLLTLAEFEDFKNIPSNPYPLFDDLLKEGSELTPENYSVVYDLIKYVTEHEFYEFKEKWLQCANMNDFGGDVLMADTNTKVNQYLKAELINLLENGTKTSDMGEVVSVFEDGTPAHTLFDTMRTFTYDISQNEFPICTYRKTATMMGIKEILWIYQDQSNDLSVLRNKYSVDYWDKFDIGNGTIGNRYGFIAKKYNIIRERIINVLKEDKTNRRAVLDLWQYTDLDSSKGLDSCAFNAIFMVRGEYLDLMLNQRSNDFLMAWSINEIQYVALQMMVAYELKLKPGKFVHNVANCHIYEKHIPAAEEILTRIPSTKQPILVFEPIGDTFEEFTIKDFKVLDYEPCVEPVDLPLAIGKM